MSRRFQSWLIVFSMGLIVSRGSAFAQTVATETDPTRRAALITVPRGLENADQAAWQRELATHATMLAHDLSLLAALSDPNVNLRLTDWYKSQGDDATAMAWLRERVRASVVPGTRLIRIYLEPSPGATQENLIVETIVNTYIEGQSERSKRAALEQVAALNDRKVKHEVRLRELNDRKNNLMLRLNLSHVGAVDRFTTTDLQLRHALARQFELHLASIAARTKSRSVQDRLDAKKDPLAVIEIMDRDQELALHRQQLMNLEAGYAAAVDDVARKAIAARTDAYRARLEKAYGEKIARARELVMLQAEAEATDADVLLAGANDQVAQLKSILGDLAICMSDYIATDQDLARERDALRGVRHEIDQSIAEHSAAPVQWAQRPAGTEK